MSMPTEGTDTTREQPVDTRAGTTPRLARQPTIEERFWSRVIKGAQGECWGWSGARSSTGYGHLRAVGTRKNVFAHRLSYEVHHGPIPPGLLVMHSCDNPPCTNPDHLSVGTDSDNQQDASRKGRLPRGERHKDARLTEEQVLEIRHLRATSSMTLRAIALRFGVGRTTVWRVIHGKTWGWLAGTTAAGDHDGQLSIDDIEGIGK